MKAGGLKIGSLIGLIAIVCVIAFFGYVIIGSPQVGIYDVSFTKAIKQGLDLTGGIEAVFQAKNSTITDQNLFNEQMDGAIKVFRTRLDDKGFTEATIVRQESNKIRIEVPINASTQTETESAEATIRYLLQPAHLVINGPDGKQIIEGKDIAKAFPTLESGEYKVAFQLNESGTKAFGDATTKFVGQPLTILVDGKTISTANVLSPIVGGNGVIEGGFTLDTARDLSNQIQSGALPIELQENEMSSISATLGYDALNTSLLAGIIGVCAVLLFMFFFYKLPGVVAGFALAVYTMIMVILLATIPGVQLTLPGFAGIILSLGMAVDANIIIFERFKDEYRSGKSLKASVDAGFKRAFRCILDSHITTMIAAVVLMIFGTGSIKGFGITLLIGAILSLFTAITVTRGLLKLLININVKHPGLFLWKRGAQHG